MHFAAGESAVAKHLLEFSKGVGVAARCRAEHDQTEGRCLWRRNAIRVGDELQRDGPATFFQCGPYLFEQALAGRHIKMMKNVGEQHDVIIMSKIHVKSASRDWVITIR